MSDPTISVMIDGRTCGPGEQHVSIFDRGFLYGDSVFETVRTYRGVPFELDAHLQRLSESASRVFIQLPVAMQVLRREVEATVAARGGTESYVRIIVTRGQGQLGLDPKLAERPTRVVIAGPLAPPPDVLYEQGAHLVSYRTQRVTDDTRASGAKVGNYLVSVLAMREARAANAHEALIVDANGDVAEGASSNVFMVSNGQVVTPGLKCGILEGITRRHVLTLARKLGYEVVERRISLDHLMRAAEVFVTSSIREILPAVRIDGDVVGDGRPGPTTRALMAAFHEFAVEAASAATPQPED